MFRPAGHYVMVKPDPVEEISAGGIVVTTEGGKKKEELAQAEGTLVAIGINAWKSFDDGDPWAKVGDRVLYPKYGGRDYKDKKGNYFKILIDSDIVGVDDPEFIVGI